jgi:hypothetical protein
MKGGGVKEGFGGRSKMGKLQTLIARSKEAAVKKDNKEADDEFDKIAQKINNRKLKLQNMEEKLIKRKYCSPKTSENLKEKKRKISFSPSGDPNQKRKVTCQTMNLSRKKAKKDFKIDDAKIKKNLSQKRIFKVNQREGNKVSRNFNETSNPNCSLDNSYVNNKVVKMLSPIRDEPNPTLKSTTQGSKFGPVSKFIYEEDTNFFAGISYESTKTVEFLNEKLKINSFNQFLFAFVSLLSGFMQYELEFAKKKPFTYLIAEWVCFVNTIGLIFTFFSEYLINCEMDYHLKKLPQSVWILTWEKMSSPLFNTLVFIWHPNPIFHQQTLHLYVLKFKFNQEIQINAIMFSLLILRLWFFFKLLVDFSEYSSARTKRVCRMNNFNVNFFFCIKALMESRPYHVYGLLLILSITMCSVLLKIYESGLDEISKLAFSSYWNCIWCTIITMTTVGFGDFYPSSLIGRIVGLISSLIGVFLMSMLVVTITNVLDLSSHEKNFYMISEKVHLDQEKNEIVGKLLPEYLTLTMKYKKELKKGNSANLDVLKQKKNQFLYDYYLFQQNHKRIESTFPPYSVFDAINENLNYLELEFGAMEERQNKTADILDKITNKLKL